METRSKWERVLLFPALIAVQAALGGNSVVSKIALNDGVDPVIYGFLRDVVAGPILMAAAVLLEGRPRIARDDHIIIVMLGVALYANQLFFILGVNYTTSVTAALFQPSIPVFTVAISLLLRLEVVHWRLPEGWLKLGGIAASVAGAVLANVLKDNSDGSSSNLALGIVCLVLNCLAMAVYSLLSKSVLQRYPPVRVTAWAYVVCTACMLLSVLGCTDCDGRWQLPASAAWALAYTAILCSAIGYGTLSWANKITSPTLVTSFWPLQVFASAVLSALFLDYSLVMADIIGGVLISVGLLAVMIGKAIEDRRARAAVSVQPAAHEAHGSRGDLERAALIGGINDQYDDDGGDDHRHGGPGGNADGDDARKTR